MGAIHPYPTFSSPGLPSHTFPFSFFLSCLRLLLFLLRVEWLVRYAFHGSCRNFVRNYQWMEVLWPCIMPPDWHDPNENHVVVYAYFAIRLCPGHLENRHIQQSRSLWRQETWKGHLNKQLKKWCFVLANIQTDRCSICFTDFHGYIKILKKLRKSLHHFFSRAGQDNCNSNGGV